MSAYNPAARHERYLRSKRGIRLRPGRPPKLTALQAAVCFEIWYRDEATFAEMALVYGVHEETIRKRCHAQLRETA